MPVSERQHENPHGILSRIAVKVGIEKPLSTFDRNNAVSVVLMGALPPIAGSAISFLLGAFFLWGLISLALRRFEFRMTHSDRVMAGTFTVFAALILLTGLLSKDPLRVFSSTVWLLPFLSPWVLIPRLRASPQLDYLRLYISGAIAGCVGALLLVCAHIAWFSSARVEGGAGNAAVFASMCLCLTGIAGLAVDSPSRTRRLLAFAAILAGTVALISSLTRGVMLTFLPVLALLLVYAQRQWRAIRVRPATLLLLLAFPNLVLYSAWGMIESRIDFTFREMERILDGHYTASIGERLRLWRAAWRAFLDSPLWGYGIQDRMQALRPYLSQDGLPIQNFTHPHNGYLAFAVDGGLIVLTALMALLAVPVAVAYRAQRDNAYRRRLFLALMLTATYAVTGMTQIMFKHDILDSFYTFTAIIIAASIPDARRIENRHQKVLYADKSRVGRAVEWFSGLVEVYMFPIFAFVVTTAGIAQSFLSASMKRDLFGIASNVMLY